jgi:hypothetical protein
MNTHEKVESYLLRLSLSYQETGKNAWVVSDRDKGIDSLFVAIADSLVILRTNVADAPKGKREALFTDLLKLNSSDMVHGAYALDGEKIVIVDTLEGETMDIEEFQASIDAIGLALSQHYKVLAKYLKKE